MESDLFFEPFKKDGSLLTIEEHIQRTDENHEIQGDVQSRYKYLEDWRKDESIPKTLDSLPKTQSLLFAVEHEAHHITTSMISAEGVYVYPSFLLLLFFTLPFDEIANITFFPRRI